MPGEVCADIVEGRRNRRHITLRVFNRGLKRKRSECFQVALQAHVIEHLYKHFAIRYVTISRSPLFEIIRQ